MEVLKQQKTQLLYIGTNKRLAKEFHRSNTEVEVIAVESISGALKWLHNQSDFRDGKWQGIGGDLDAFICEQHLAEDDLVQLKKYIEQTFDPAKKTPFLLLGDTLSKAEKVRAMENGFDDFFTHPVDFKKLLDRIGFLKELKTNLRKQEIRTSSEQRKYSIGFWKRSFDVLLAGSILLVAAPFLLLVILAIRLESKGKVYYISKRVGTGYRIFNFLKLRSMYPDADKRLKEFEHLNQYVHEDNGTETFEAQSFENGPKGPLLIGDDSPVDEIGKHQKCLC